MPKKKSRAARRPTNKLNAKSKAELSLWKKADKAVAALHAHLEKQPTGLLYRRYFDWSPRHGLIEHCTARLEITVDPKVAAKQAKLVADVKKGLRWVQA